MLYIQTNIEPALVADGAVLQHTVFEKPLGTIGSLVQNPRRGPASVYVFSELDGHQHAVECADEGTCGGSRLLW